MSSTAKAQLEDFVNGIWAWGHLVIFILWNFSLFPPLKKVSDLSQRMSVWITVSGTQMGNLSPRMPGQGHGEARLCSGRGAHRASDSRPFTLPRAFFLSGVQLGNGFLAVLGKASHSYFWSVKSREWIKYVCLVMSKRHETSAGKMEYY